MSKKYGYWKNIDTGQLISEFNFTPECYNNLHCRNCIQNRDSESWCPKNWKLITHEAYEEICKKSKEKGV